MGMLGGRYQLISPLGRGGASQVWEALDEHLGRRIAVKLLHADRVGQDHLGKRFAREAMVTAGLSHPGIPVVHDAGMAEVVGGRCHPGPGDAHHDFFIAMQLVEGLTLSELIDEQGPLPVAWAASIGAQIAAVLVAAHADGFVHRDLKPSNIMITSSGAVKVLDFGLASVLNEMSTITFTGEIVGTLRCISPEQIRNRPTTPRTDLYGLGCIIYEMLAGRPPFEGDDEVLIQQHLSQAPGRLKAPRELAELTTSLLEKDPTARPEGAAETYARLRPHLTAADPLGDIEPDGNLYARALALLADDEHSPSTARPPRTLSQQLAGWFTPG